MAVINTGIVERTIVGVNESDLFLDSEATSVATNTGIVERSIVGVHDANFVRPLGDEEISNGGFDTDSDWAKGTGWTISGGKGIATNTTTNSIYQDVLTLSKSYKASFTISSIENGSLKIGIGINFSQEFTEVGTYTYYGTPSNDGLLRITPSNGTNATIDNVSVKEMLVNRESTTTNTGIVERPITGVNASDPMFPDNTISNIVNIAGLISSLLADLEARATTFENREGTQNILINLQKC